MRPQFRNGIFVFHIVLGLSFAFPAHGQSVRVFLPERAKDWQRVVTAADSTIDVNISSLVLEPNGIFRATFRTSLAKSEEAFEKPGVKYKTRVETIQFDSRTQAYRSIETTLFDSSDKSVLASGSKTGAKWRPLGSTAAKMYGAALRTGPFAAWRIARVRYADGRVVTSDEDAQLAQLSGATVWIEFDRFAIARDECRKLSYESREIGNDEFHKWTGKSLKDVGLEDEKISALKISCEQKPGAFELHYLFGGSDGRATLLSGGVLIDLEKQ